MKKEKNQNSTPISLNRKTSLNEIYDPELREVITDVIHYSEDYDININEDFY